MKKLISVGIACLFLLTVCTAGCVSSDPIVGTWIVDPDYIDTLTSDYGYSSTLIATCRAGSITFRSDGTVVFTNLPGVQQDVNIYWKNNGDNLYCLYSNLLNSDQVDFYLSKSKIQLSGISWVKA